MLSTQIRGELADHLDSAERDRAPISPLIAHVSGHRRRRRLRDPAHQHQASCCRWRKGGRTQGRTLVTGDAADDGRRRARLRSPARRDGRVRGPSGRHVALLPSPRRGGGRLHSGADLPGAGCTEQDVIDATVAYAPSIELIDSRIKDWKIGLIWTLSRTTRLRRVHSRQGTSSPVDIDIKAIDAVLTCNGERIAEGRSDAVLGNPVTAVAWLAQKVDTFGVRLKAGDIVLPGSCTRAIDAHPGDNFRAEFSGLGSVSLQFT